MGQAQVSQAGGKGILLGIVQIVAVPVPFGMIVIQTGGSEMEGEEHRKSESNLLLKYKAFFFDNSPRMSQFSLS